MSHFTVAVISETLGDVSKLLAPYQENNMGDCPKEFMEFFDMEVEYLNEYETGSFKKVKNRATGEEMSYYDDRLWKKEKPGEMFSRSVFTLPDDCFVFQALYREEYPTLQDYLKAEHSCEPDENGRYGYWANPNSKWDYWRVGGRWRGLLKATKGLKGELAWELAEEAKNGQHLLEAPGYYDCAQIKDIDFSMDMDAYNKALRFWEINVEGSPLREDEKNEDFATYWNADYFRDRYASKEEYAKEQASFSAWAFVTPNGNWHEKGQMGWWAMNDATSESIKTFTEAFQKALDDVSPEYFITIVDCHV